VNEVPTTDALLNVNQAAQYLGISARALKDLCWTGKITFMKVNHRHWRFRPEDIEEYLDRVTFKRKSVYGS
jgi:excisionase family DNA binding protein